MADKDKTTYFSGAIWEPLLGYSRAVKVNNLIVVSATTALDQSGTLVGVGDAYVQTKQTIENIKVTLQEAGASLNDVIRTRLYVTDISRWKQFGQAHREAFGKVNPATTIVEVNSLIDPRMLIAIEAEALLV